MQLPITRDALTIELGALPAGEDPTAEGGYRLERRFDRSARLFSEQGLARLARAHVVLVGVGGVGSFAAEALSRSGIGRITLVDFDRVCITNTNRQLHAMQGTIGRPKVEVMAERLRRVHPTGQVDARMEIYSPETSEAVLTGADFVIDAIDSISAKLHLIATCLERKLPMVSVMGAAARMDPTQVIVADLTESYNDPLAAMVRKRLRQNYGVEVERGKPLGIPTVFSAEVPVLPAVPSYDHGDGFRCVCPGGTEGRADCDHRKRIDGTASFVTGTFGLTAASVVVRTLIDEPYRAAARAGGSTERGEADARARERRLSRQVD